MDQPVTYRDFAVCIWDEDSTPEWVHKCRKLIDKNSIIYVPLEGNDDKYLHPDRFIVKNRTASLNNHFLWEELLLEEEQDERMWAMVDKFIDEGKQYIIEDYEFTKDEPFYEYSNGRDE